MHIMWYVMGCVLLLVVNVDWEYLLGKHKQQGGCREDALDQGPNFVQWFLQYLLHQLPCYPDVTQNPFYLSHFLFIA